MVTMGDNRVGQGLTGQNASTSLIICVAGLQVKNIDPNTTRQTCLIIRVRRFVGQIQVHGLEDWWIDQ